MARTANVETSTNGTARTRGSVTAQMSVAFEKAIDNYAAVHGYRNTSDFVRTALATAIDYDLSNEPVYDRGVAMKAAALTRKRNAKKQSKTVDILMQMLAQMSPEMAAQAQEAINGLVIDDE